MNAMQEAARRLHSMGFKTLPIKPGTKEPNTRHGVKDATDSDAVTDAWYAQHPNDGIGVSGEGFVIFDFDVKDGLDGRDAMVGWKLPDTLAQTTPSGGYHLFYKTDEEVHPSVNQQLAVDVRGWHSYVVCDPTPGYRFEDDEIGIAHADDVVMDFLAYVSPSPRPKSTNAGGSVGEGGRNDYLFREGSSLRSDDKNTDEHITAMLHYLNRKNCKPPLPDAEVDKIAQSVLGMRPGLSEEVRQKKRGRPRKFEHNKVARRLIVERGACFLDGMPALRAEDGGRYFVGWEAFDAAIIDMHDDSTAQNRREVKKYIAAKAPKLRQSPADLVAFENGVLDIRDMSFRDWLPSDRIANVIPHRWNPDAESELLDRTLEKMADGDLGTLMNLHEFMGICMARSSRRYPFFPVLLGEGANGKSTYISLLRNMLGMENISSLQPHEISARFMGTHIVGKTANLGDDISDGYLNASDCSVIKSVATGDLMFTDVKGGEGFEFEPYCTMVFSCNAFPRLADTTDGFMRRLFPVEFNAKFTRDDPDFDPLISEKLVDEAAMERACVLGVEGLRRVIEQNCPTPNPMSEAMKAEIAREGNTALQWINDENITAEHIVGMTKSEVHDEYLHWAEDNGYGRTAMASGTLAAQVGTYFRLKCQKTAHRGEGLNRKSVRVFDYNVPKRAETCQV